MADRFHSRTETDDADLPPDGFAADAAPLPFCLPSLNRRVAG
jgi:hypothetical protein